jgi:hypothetical protein
MLLKDPYFLIFKCCFGYSKGAYKEKRVVNKPEVGPDNWRGII